MTDSSDPLAVSVILCTYSPAMFGHFREAAESVLQQTYDRVELVVIVDGSDELFERVDERYGAREDVVLRLNDRNVGLLESRNVGAGLATGDVIAFIDDDAVADPRWIEHLVQTFQQTDAAAAGGRMTADWVAGVPTFLPEEFYWLVGVTHRGFGESAGEVRNTFGSNLAFRREVFLDLDGFDAEIGGRKGDVNLQGGETELCARLRSAYGEGVQYNPEAVVAHKVFDYRTDLTWLVDRAFWQGYSKRAMATMVPGAARTEGEFLRKLLFGYVPERLKRLVTGPTVSDVSQLASLFVLTTAVGFGYLYAFLRYPPDAVAA